MGADAQKCVNEGGINLDFETYVKPIFAKPKFSRRMMLEIPESLREFIAKIQRGLKEYNPLDFAVLEVALVEEFGEFQKCKTIEKKLIIKFYLPAPTPAELFETENKMSQYQNVYYQNCVVYPNDYMDNSQVAYQQVPPTMVNGDSQVYYQQPYAYGYGHTEDQQVDYNYVDYADYQTGNEYLQPQEYVLLEVDDFGQEINNRQTQYLDLNQGYYVYDQAYPQETDYDYRANEVQIQQNTSIYPSNGYTQDTYYYDQTLQQTEYVAQAPNYSPLCNSSNNSQQNGGIFNKNLSLSTASADGLSSNLSPVVNQRSLNLNQQIQTMQNPILQI